MTALTSEQRRKLWRLFMARGHCPSSIRKQDLRAAIDALDDFIDTTGAAAINAALPQPFRGAATPEQKALVLAYLALERAGVSGFDTLGDR